MYSADELVEYIKSGIVTFEELCNDTDGYFSASVRKEVERKMETSEEQDWTKAKNSKSIEALEKYLLMYPDGNYRNEARSLICSIEKNLALKDSADTWEQIDKNSISELKRFCEENPTDLHCTEAKKLINKLRREEVIGFDIDALVTSIKKIQADKAVLNADDEIYKTIAVR